MPLTHVGRWDQAQKRIVATTPEEAAKRHSRSLGSRESPYICMLCQQRVLFIYGKKTPHFKHSCRETDKDCEERCKYYNELACRHSFTMEDGLLPMRLLYENNSFTVEAGFHPLPELTLEWAETYNIKAHLICNGQLEHACYNVGRSRFSSEETVYYPASQIGGEYQIRLDGAEMFCEDFHIWLRARNSIKELGTVFDGDSRRRLPDCGDALIGKPYTLLLHRKAPPPQSGVDVSIELLCQQGDWYLYRIVAQILTPQSALFFLRFGLSLRERTTCAEVLWPPMWEDTHILDTPSSSLYFLISEKTRLVCEGDGKVVQDRGSVVEVSHGPDDLLLRLVRDTDPLEMLQYFYIRGEHRHEPPKQPHIQVWQMDGALVNEGKREALPPGGRLRVLCQFNGRVTRSCGQILTFAAPIWAGNLVQIETPQLGETLHIYQGMDCCFRLELCVQKAMPIEKNMAFIHASHEIPITRRAGTLLQHIEKEGQAARILKDAIRKGYISRNMLALIVVHAKRNLQ